ncbi:MAG: hypothetical protein AAF500_16640 [Myxococcota bacterium]
MDLVLRSQSDDDEPLTGTRVWVNGTLRGASLAGRLRTTLGGSAAASRVIRIVYECPEGYRNADGMMTLQVRPFRSLDQAGADALEVMLRCELVEHVAAIVVRVREPRSIPILLGGAEAAETDAAGFGVFTRRMPPGAVLEVTLNTAAFPDLRPASPSRTFVVSDVHEVFVFDQTFSVARAPVRKRFRPPRIVKIE